MKIISKLILESKKVETADAISVKILEAEKNEMGIIPNMCLHGI